MSQDRKTALIALAEKIAWGSARRAFTRSKNPLMIQRRVRDSELLVARNALVKSYSDVEKANTNHQVASEIDIEENQEEKIHLDQPHQDLRWSNHLYQVHGVRRRVKEGC